MLVWGICPAKTKSPSVKGDAMDEQLMEVIKSLIYHGRYFAKWRDPVVEKKALDRIKLPIETADTKEVITT